MMEKVAVVERVKKRFGVDLYDLKLLLRNVARNDPRYHTYVTLELLGAQRIKVGQILFGTPEFAGMYIQRNYPEEDRVEIFLSMRAEILPDNVKEQLRELLIASVESLTDLALQQKATRGRREGLKRRSPGL